MSNAIFLLVTHIYQLHASLKASFSQSCLLSFSHVWLLYFLVSADEQAKSWGNINALDRVKKGK